MPNQENQVTYAVVSPRASLAVSASQVLRVSTSRAPLYALNSDPFTKTLRVGYPRICAHEAEYYYMFTLILSLYGIHVD